MRRPHRSQDRRRCAPETWFGRRQQLDAVEASGVSRQIVAEGGAKHHPQFGSDIELGDTMVSRKLLPLLAWDPTTAVKNQRNAGLRLNRVERGRVDRRNRFLSKMKIAYGDSQGVDAGLLLEQPRISGRGRLRGSPIDIADSSDLSFDGHSRGARSFDDAPGQSDILGEREPRAIDHHRREAIVDSFGAFANGSRMIDMADHRYLGRIREGTKHLSEQRDWHVPPTGRSRLQDDGRPGVFRRMNVGARILPAQNNKAGDRPTLFRRASQHIRKCGGGHRNFAIISLMPGIVSIWSACAGWKYWMSDRWLRPP